MKRKCWHCSDTNLCDCILCGIDTRTGRKAGKCQACVGRKFREKHADVVAAFEPRDRKNWLHHPACNGNSVWKEYIPFIGLE
jgi:hypothetical protein